jgi:hypothetical protein
MQISMGLRFPFREELNVTDNEPFRTQGEKPVFIIAEVKSGKCKLNGLGRTLEETYSMCPQSHRRFRTPIVEEVAAALYKRFMYEDQQLKITLLAIGSRINQEYLTERPEVRQLLFRDMIQFIIDAFVT